MKILFLEDNFPPYNNVGGAGTVASSLAYELKKKGNDVFVITSVQDKSNEGSVEDNGLKVFKIYSKYHIRWQAYLSLYNPRTVEKIKKIIEQISPDVVHAHNIHYYLSYHALKLAKQSGAKVFLTAHDAMLFHYGKVDNANKISPWAQLKKYKLRYNPFRNLVIKSCLKYVDQIFAVSFALKDALVQNGIKNITVIHNGIDVNCWELAPSVVEGFKEKYGLLGKELVLFGGRISLAKGSRQALLALELVRQKIPEAELMVLGREQLPGAENLGWLSGEELKVAFSSSDVVIVPSLYLDPLPTVVLEAMASKKPVVGTCSGGTPEMIVDGQTGYIVDPSDTSLLAKRIIELLSDNSKAKSFGEAGFERVRKEFNLETQVNELLNWYKSIN